MRSGVDLLNSINDSAVEKGMKILPPFETPVGRVGSMICFDVRVPEASCDDPREQPF